MQNFPHHYPAAASATPDKHVELSSPGLTSIQSAGPAQFGGPGDLWSPETLLTAAVANCFVLSFKAIARASKFDWTGLKCDAVGVLDRVDNINRFTEFRIRAVLDVPAGTDEGKAMRLLEKSERACLITNSMTAANHLEAQVRIVG